MIRKRRHWRKQWFVHRARLLSQNPLCQLHSQMRTSFGYSSWYLIGFSVTFQLVYLLACARCIFLWVLNSREVLSLARFEIWICWNKTSTVLSITDIDALVHLSQKKKGSTLRSSWWNYTVVPFCWFRPLAYIGHNGTFVQSSVRSFVFRYVNLHINSEIP